MTRDADRSRVYAVEELVFGETLFAEPIGEGGVLDLAAAIAVDPWWVECGVAFKVVPARRESNHSLARMGPSNDDVAHIRLTVHQQDAATLAHELAHLLAHVHGADVAHGALFRAAEIDLVTLVCGPAASRRLERAFAGDGLDAAPRRWDAPSGRIDHGLYGRWRARNQVAAATRHWREKDPTGQSRICWER